MKCAPASRLSRHFTSIAILALALTACANSAATFSDTRRARAVRKPAAPSVVQWNHEWARGAVFYEIFVRSFYDSNGDGIGDLPGLISKLDYLNDGNPATTTDLGIDAIWLMPVFASPSYHGYDTTDYETINPQYGTNADFEELCRQAHARGIKVIVDFVMNHTSDQHPWFIDSASSPNSAHRDWYVWSPTDLGWNPPWGGTSDTWHPLNGAWYYGVFWSGMPDLNFRTQAVRNEMERLAKLWLDRGVDGFRLDATRHLIETGPGAGESDTAETHAYLKEFAAAVRRVKPGATLVGENWTDTPIIAQYFGSTSVIAGGDELPMNFNFPLASEILASVNATSSTRIASKILEMQRSYPPGITDAPFLTNHDQIRVATQLANNNGRMRSAAAILLTLPGAPFLYYGEELGMQNSTADGDPSKRTPMPWDGTVNGGFTTGTPWAPFSPGKTSANVSSEVNDPSSLLSRYRALIAARKSSQALQKGTITLLSSATATGSVLAFISTTDGEQVLVVHNLSDSPVGAGPYNVTASHVERVYADQGTTDPTVAGGAINVVLPPRASGVWRLVK